MECTLIRTYIYIHAYIHAYIHTCRHTYMHAYIHIYPVYMQACTLTSIMSPTLMYTGYLC